MTVVYCKEKQEAENGNQCKKFLIKKANRIGAERRNTAFFLSILDFITWADGYLVLLPLMYMDNL